jgi:hypothetical protein
MNNEEREEETHADMDAGLDGDSYYSEGIDRDFNELDFDPHLDNPASFNSLNRQFNLTSYPYKREPAESRQVTTIV